MLRKRKTGEPEHVDVDFGPDTAAWLAAWDALPLPLCLQDLEFRVLHANRALEATFGHPLAWLRGRDARVLVHPDDHGALLARRESLLRLGDGEHLPGERRGLTRDGKVLLQRVRCTRIRDAHGAPRMLSVTESVLPLSSHQRPWLAGGDWRFLLFENSPLPQVLLDVRGRILEVNDAFCGFLAVQPEQAAGRALADLLDAGSGDDMRRLMRSPHWAMRGLLRGLNRRAVRADGSEALFDTAAREFALPDGERLRLVTLLPRTSSAQAPVERPDETVTG